MIYVKSIDDISKIVLGQKTTFMIKSLNLESDKVFIFIRNLGLHSEDIILDFSEYDNQQDILEKWIVDYMNSDIQVDLQTLNIALSKRILDYLTFWKLNNGKFEYNGNYRKFTEQNQGLLDDLCRFLSSSIFYSASVVSRKKIPYVYQSTITVRTFKQNALNLFSYVKMFEVELMLKKYDKFNYLMFQDQKFAEKFFKLATTSTYALFLYGQSTPQWKLFQQLLAHC